MLKNILFLRSNSIFLFDMISFIKIMKNLSETWHDLAEVLL